MEPNKYYIEYFDENNKGFLGNSEIPWIETATGFKNAKALIETLANDGYKNIQMFKAYPKPISKETIPKDNFEKLARIEELKEMIAVHTQELQNLQAYFENKNKVGQVIGGKIKNGNKGLLGLNNKVVYHPTAYCNLKQVYLLYDDIRDKQCYHKDCNHLIVLTEQEQKKGIKGLPMKYFERNIDCEGSRKEKKK